MGHFVCHVLYTTTRQERSEGSVIGQEAAAEGTADISLSYQFCKCKLACQAGQTYHL